MVVHQQQQQRRRCNATSMLTPNTGAAALLSSLTLQPHQAAETALCSPLGTTAPHCMQPAAPYTGQLSNSPASSSAGLPATAKQQTIARQFGQPQHLHQHCCCCRWSTRCHQTLRQLAQRASWRSAAAPTHTQSTPAAAPHTAAALSLLPPLPQQQAHACRLRRSNLLHSRRPVYMPQLRKLLAYAMGFTSGWGTASNVVKCGTMSEPLNFTKAPLLPIWSQ